MFKYKSLIFIGIIVLLAAGAFTYYTFAANEIDFTGIVDFNIDSVDGTPVATTVLAQNPSQVNDIDIGDNYLDFTIDSGGSLTLNAAGGKYLQLTNPLPAGLAANPTCVLDQVTLTATALATVRVETISTMPVCPSGTGTTRSTGSVIVPTNYSFTINGGASCTESLDVSLNLQVQNAIQVIISQDQDFVDAQWQSLPANDLTFSLDSGDGEKEVFVMFRSSTGSLSTKLSQTIEYKSAGCAPGTTEPTVTEPETTEPGDETEPDAEPVTVAPQFGLSFGDLIKGSGDAVYYYGADGNRHPFPGAKIYFSWYANFNNIKEITNTQLASLVMGENVTYKPGVRMVKLTTSPKVYAVDQGAVLRWVVSESAAAELYGSNWNTFINDLSDDLFSDYTIGADITGLSDFDPAAVSSQVVDINMDRGW